MGSKCTLPNRDGSILEAQLQFIVNYVVRTKINTHQNNVMDITPGFNCSVMSSKSIPSRVPLEFSFCEFVRLMFMVKALKCSQIFTL